MHINFRIRWSLGPEPGTELDPFLFRLLEQIRSQGALNQAVRLLGCSYRHAWGLIKRWEKEFGVPLVKLQRGRGRGAELTAFGEKLLWTNRKLIEDTAPRLQGFASDLNASLAEFTGHDRQFRLHIHASHDLAVQHLYELLPDQAGLNADLQTRGSLESLYALNTGQCHVAGFHFPLGDIGTELLPRYLRWLEEDRHSLVQLAARQQGIMTRPGNPKRITGIDDLSKRSVRFINRQKGSGTRTVFDQLLDRTGIPAAAINGYGNEEFTHFAVAAMIASGEADAGFGLQAAAARFGLDFIPVLEERYILAFNRERELIESIQRLLRTPQFRDPMARLQGYDVTDTGTEIRLPDLAA
ncbi:MAG: substrate-binding domain-containing protein [Gammaproteobacteria bacterium]